MALELPGYVVVAFNLIGLPWPGIDEDELRAWAAGARQFADDVRDNSSQVNQAMRELAGSSQSSVTGAVAGDWERHHRLLTGLHGPVYDFAESLDIAADAVYAQKLVIIGAAAALAAEFTATQIGAIFTLGADEAAVPAEVISTRAIVKFALEELAGVIIGKLINYAAQEISGHLNHTISSMLSGALQVGMEVQSLKLTPQAVSDASKKLTGQAAEVEETGQRAHAENASRSIEDTTGGGGWSEVINALRQMLLDIAGSLFRDLPATISSVLGDIAGFLLRFAERIKTADEEGPPAVAADDAKAPFHEDTSSSGAGSGEPEFGDESGTSGGQASEGNGATHTAGDPIDIVSGQVLLTTVDLECPECCPWSCAVRTPRVTGPAACSVLAGRARWTSEYRSTTTVFVSRATTRRSCTIRFQASLASWSCPSPAHVGRCPGTVRRTPLPLRTRAGVGPGTSTLPP